MSINQYGDQLDFLDPLEGRITWDYFEGYRDGWDAEIARNREAERVYLKEMERIRRSGWFGWGCAVLLVVVTVVMVVTFR